MQQSLDFIQDGANDKNILYEEVLQAEWSDQVQTAGKLTENSSNQPLHRYEERKKKNAQKAQNIKRY